MLEFLGEQTMSGRLLSSILMKSESTQKSDYFSFHLSTLVGLKIQTLVKSDGFVNRNFSGTPKTSRLLDLSRSARDLSNFYIKI